MKTLCALMLCALALSVQADDAPLDMGKDMAKGQMDSPDMKAQAARHKPRYKTMKMKKAEMARQAATSGPALSVNKAKVNLGHPAP